MLLHIPDQKKNNQQIKKQGFLPDGATTGTGTCQSAFFPEELVCNLSKALDAVEVEFSVEALVVTNEGTPPGVDPWMAGWMEMPCWPR